MTIERVLRWVLLGGIFSLALIPLVVADSLFFPFITGKNFAFRILVEIMAASWLVLALINPAYRPRWTWLLGAFAAFVAIIGVADLLSPNVLKSFWSNFERMEGWVTLAHLLVLLVVVVSTLTTEKLWRRWFMTSIGVSILVGLYGLLQLWGIIDASGGGTQRIAATFGNSTYVAGYMIFHIFLTALVWVQYRVEGASVSRRFLSLGASATILLQVLTLLFTGTRGSTLGLIGGTILTAVLLLVLARNSRTVWRVSVVVIGGVVLFASFFFIVKDHSWAREITPINRLASISLQDKTVQARFMNWEMAIQGAQERPLLGWGQASYNVVFNKYYNPQMYEQEPWFDRTHNVILDWLVQGGLLGLIAYLSIFGIAMWYLWGSRAFTIPERSILTGLLAAYGFHNLFVFDNITSYLMFVFVLGYLATRVANYADKKPMLAARGTLPARYTPIALAAAVVLAAGLVWSVNASALAANRTLLLAISPVGTLEERLERFEQVIAYDTYGTQEAREQLLQRVIQLVGDAEADQATKAAYVEAAERELLAQIEAAPQDARFPFFLAQLYEVTGQYAKAQQYFEQALALSPNKQHILLALGINAFNQDDHERALQILRDTHELAPEFNDPLIVYTFVAIRAGETALADELLGELVERRAAVDSRIINALLTTQQYGRIVTILERHVEENPENVQARVSLAVAYYASGQQANAVETLDAVIAEFPQLAGEVAGLKQQIEAGTLPIR